MLDRLCVGNAARGAKMPETPAFDRPLITGTASADPVPPGTERVEYLIEGIGIAIFVALAVGAAVILIRNRRG